MVPDVAHVQVWLFCLDPEANAITWRALQITSRVLPFLPNAINFYKNLGVRAKTRSCLLVLCPEPRPGRSLRCAQRVASGLFRPQGLGDLLYPFEPLTLLRHRTLWSWRKELVCSVQCSFANNENSILVVHFSCCLPFSTCFLLGASVHMGTRLRRITIHAMAVRAHQHAPQPKAPHDHQARTKSPAAAVGSTIPRHSCICCHMRAELVITLQRKPECS